jgi:hypothetical protein
MAGLRTAIGFLSDFPTRRSGIERRGDSGSGLSVLSRRLIHGCLKISAMVGRALGPGASRESSWSQHVDGTTKVPLPIFVNGSVPVIITTRTTPSDQTSAAFSSYSSPFKISGDEYRKAEKPS